MTDTTDKDQSTAAQDQPTQKKWSRRQFLIRGTLGTMGVVALGTFLFRNPLRRAALDMADSMILPYSGTGTEATLWFEITTDNKVIYYSPKVEMGQGTFTGLAQIAADELDVAVEQMQVVAAESNSGIVDGLSTGGSLSVASLWQPLRELAATLREMIKLAAAKQLNVPVGDLTTKNGMVTGAGQAKTYAEIAAGVTDWVIPSTPPLRPVEDYQYVGKPIPRIDLEAKVFGDPIFGLDAEMPEMLHAAVIRPEHIGAKFKGADTSKAEKMPGVVQVIQMDDWVGVVAKSYSQALAAKRLIDVEWDVSKKWTEQEIRDILTVGNGSEMVHQMRGTALDPGGDGVESITFTSPLGAHAQIEPNGAVAYVENDNATVILSTQVVGITQRQVSDALGIPLQNVNIIPTYLGGGFGRRLNTVHAVRAAQLSQAVGKPVKYSFTRKEEFQHDLFRPPTQHVMRGKLASDGLFDSLEHHYASGDVAINSVLLPPIANSILGLDMGAMRGGNIQYDKIPNLRSIQWHSTLPFATSWWRSLGLLANTFAIESFVDEIALQSGQDPIDFRLKQLGDGEASTRIAAVIKKVAETSGFYNDVRDGKAMGFATSIDANVPCAQAIEASIENGNLKVHRVVCAMDCGLAVNPDQVRAQCEGCIIMGLSAAVHEQMTIVDGQLHPTMYGPYDMALIKHAPKEMETHLLQGADHPLPVGEPPMGPIGAAIGNALRRITGKRLTDLPLQI